MAHTLKAPPTRPAASGFTLVESLFSLSILVLALMLAMRVLHVNGKAQREMATKELLEERVRRSTEGIVNRLRPAAFASISGVPTSPATSASIRFRRPESFSPATGITFGAEEVIQLTLDDGEILNSVDDDGDGLTDEGTLAWRRGSDITVLARDVIELSFGQQDRAIEISVGCAGIAVSGQVIVRGQAEVALKN